MKNKYNKQNCIIFFLIFIILFIVGIYFLNISKNNYNDNIANYLAINAQDNVVYLSDIEFNKAQTARGNIYRDKTSSKNTLSLKVEGNHVTFEKGIWAHATSTIEFDLSKYKDYDYFITYFGVNETSRNNGNGVKFYVYTSNDGVNWNLKTEENPNTLKSDNEAKYIKVNIKDAMYLKLYAHDNGHNGNDNSIWADAKLVKKDYPENIIKTVDEYDKEIKESYNGTITENLIRLILQRDLVKNVGQLTIRTFLAEKGLEKEHAETLNWLMNNHEVLKMYVMNGNPNGTYKNSLEVLNRLYHTYKKDLLTNAVTRNGNKLRLIYEKMIISLSLTHSDNVSFWIKPMQEENDKNSNVSNPVIRYEILKKMLLNNKLSPLFEQLEVEEMRYIMYSFINDDELEWLNAYAKSKKNQYSAFSYMEYKDVNINLYRSSKYYGEKRKDYDKKYNLSRYNVQDVPSSPRLWMIMDTGGVCWQLSNVGQNVLTSLGIPATIVGQPGHTAYIVYGKDNLGRSTWALWNDFYGWAETNTSGYTDTKSYYTIRLLNGWGNGDYASPNSGTYIMLAQSAIDDYKNYVKASLLVKLADTYHNDNVMLEKIYRQALSIQDINFDAWLGLVNLYINSKKTDEEYYNLATYITESLKYYPLPMHDLLKMLNAKISSTDVLVQFNVLETRALTKASKATEKNIAQSDVVIKMANYILNMFDKKADNL